MLSDIANTPQFQSSWRWPLWCYITGHRKMSVLGTASAMLTTQENSVMMWSLKGPKMFCVSWNLLEMKKIDGFHIMALPIRYILIRVWVEFLIGQFILEEVTFSIRLGPLRWVPTAHCAGRRGLNLLTAVRPVELSQYQGISTGFCQFQVCPQVNLYMYLPHKINNHTNHFSCHIPKTQPRVFLMRKSFQF